MEKNNYINLKKIDNKIISINLDDNSVEKLKNIFNLENGILFFKDLENENIIINDKEDLIYFIEHIKNNNKIIINNETYNKDNEFILYKEDDFEYVDFKELILSNKSSETFTLIQ